MTASQKRGVDPAVNGSNGVERPSKLVFVAVALGGLGVGFGLAATILMIKNKQRASVGVAPAVSAAPGATPSAREVSRGEAPWSAWLRSNECPVACCGGSACAVTEANAGKNRCKPGSPFCEGCASGLTCIPGVCGEHVTPGVSFTLHLSNILERGSAGEPVDSCRSQRDLWLCVGRPEDSELKCVSQREACSNRYRSPVGIPITSDQLLREKLWIEVREGGPDGPTLAQRDAVPYRDGLQRRGLCQGLKLSFEASLIAGFTYYLDLPSEGTPEPVPAKRRPEAAQPGFELLSGAVDAGGVDGAASE